MLSSITEVSNHFVHESEHQYACGCVPVHVAV